VARFNLRIPTRYTQSGIITEISSQYDVDSGGYLNYASWQETVSLVIDRYEYSLIDGDKIRESDFRMIYIPEAGASPPAINSQLTLASGATYKMVQVNPTYVGAELQVVEAQLREDFS
jgi:hypothetical protein